MNRLITLMGDSGMVDELIIAITWPYFMAFMVPLSSQYLCMFQSGELMSA